MLLHSADMQTHACYMYSAVIDTPKETDTLAGEKIYTDTCKSNMIASLYLYTTANNIRSAHTHAGMCSYCIYMYTYYSNIIHLYMYMHCRLNYIMGLRKLSTYKNM